MYAVRAWGRKLGAAAWLAASLAVGAEALEAREASWDKVAGGRQPGKPVLAVIGLREQKITVYDSEGAVLQAPVSTGQRGYETPAGIFTILQKNRDHVSNLYEDAEMPFMQRITWSGIALHAGPLPGHRASHGCVRLPYRFAERLFDLTGVGTRIVIVPKKADALSVSHPLLGSLQRAGATASSADAIEGARLEATKARQEADTLALRAQQAAAAARSAEAAKDRALKRLAAAVARAETQKVGPAKGLAEAQVHKLRAEASSKMAAAVPATKLAESTKVEQATAEQRAREARLRAWPLSVLVSLRTQRIHVRHGLEAVLDVPAVVREPDKPIGTHAFYATEAGGSRGWLTVSLTGKDDSGDTARAALDRIKMPDEVTQLFGRGAWLGSALIISDEPPHKETGPGTDFVVVLSNEPQGALKIRSPSRPMAQLPRPTNQMEQVRAYRPPPDDHHFRHPLGGFFP